MPPSAIRYCWSLQLFILSSTLLLVSSAASPGSLPDFCSEEDAPPISPGPSSSDTEQARQELRCLIQEAKSAVDRLSAAIMKHTQLLNLPAGPAVALQQEPIKGLQAGKSYRIELFWPNEARGSRYPREAHWAMHLH